MASVADFPFGTKVWFKYSKTASWPAKVHFMCLRARVPCVRACACVPVCVRARVCVRFFHCNSAADHVERHWGQVIEPNVGIMAKPTDKKPILVYFFGG